MWKGPPIEEKTRKRIALLRSWRFKANICRSNWTRWQLLRRKINLFAIGMLFAQRSCNEFGWYRVTMPNVHANIQMSAHKICIQFANLSGFSNSLRGNFIHYSFIWLHSLTPFWCISFKMLNRYSFIQLERGSRNSWYYANL